MFLQSLILQHIRKHNSLSLEFSPDITVIVGDNASGKTTVVEAIHMLSTGDSFRATTIEEMIQFDAELARISATFLDSAANTELDEESDAEKVEVLLTRGIVQGKRTNKKLFSLNGVKKLRKNVVGKLLSVAFRPEDMRLIEGSPSRRRSFIDTVLSATDYQYAYALTQYEGTLKRRNKLLVAIKEGEQPRSVLTFWNQSLLKHGTYIQQQRTNFFAQCSGVSFPLEFSIVYEPSVISEDRMNQYKDKELAAGKTLIGPHKDDFSVMLEHWRETQHHPLNVGTFGSRGQQRLAVLWLKLCELFYVEHIKKQKPLLLLDDILSELDDESKQLIYELVPKYQTVLTTISEVEANHLKQSLQNLNIKEYSF